MLVLQTVQFLQPIRMLKNERNVNLRRHWFKVSFKVTPRKPNTLEEWILLGAV